MTERERMDAAQQALGDLKKHLKAIQEINEKEGRDMEANEVFLHRSTLNVWHAKVTKSLHKLWPEHASEIQTRGPGGR